MQALQVSLDIILRVELKLLEAWTLVPFSKRVC